MNIFNLFMLFVCLSLSTVYCVLFCDLKSLKNKILINKSNILDLLRLSKESDLDSLILQLKKCNRSGLVLFISLLLFAFPAFVPFLYDMLFQSKIPVKMLAAISCLPYFTMLLQKR